MADNLFEPKPDPRFIILLSEYLPHEHRISKRLPNGNTRDEVLPGTNFMEDVLRVYQFSSENNFFHLLEKNRRNMWLKPYANEVKDFLRTNHLSPDLLDNIWLLRCRISFSLESAWWKERNRYGHESEQIKRINFLRNHVLPFIKAIQGEWQYSQSDDNVHSVTFKTNKPGVKAFEIGRPPCQ